MRQKPLGLLLSVLVLTWPLVARSEAVKTPSASIDSLHAELLSVMKNAKTLGYDGRTEKLSPVIPQHFDVAFMARKAVGRHWKKASDDEKRRYLKTFERFLVANYAGRFDGYSGQQFETLGHEPARQETVLVKTRLLDPGNDDVELNYRMREVESDWKVVDVYMDGTVSELALRRSEFSSIVKRDNFDGLIEALDQKITKLKSGEEQP